MATFVTALDTPQGRSTFQTRPVYAFSSFSTALPAGEHLLDLNGLIKAGNGDFGLFIQSSAACSIDLTMCSAAEVAESEDSALWNGTIPIPPNKITPIVNEDGVNLFGSVMKLVLTVNTRVFIGFV
jgi:hypothetical protein